MSIIRSINRTAAGAVVLSLINDGGEREEFDLTQYIREIIADELGLPLDASLAERIALLRNDGGASL